MLKKMGRRPRFDMAEIQTGPPAERQVAIEVKAAGVNFAEVLMVHGLYMDAPRTPFIPGYEVAGIVKEAGKKSGYKKGDRVAALTNFGGWAKEIVLDDKQVVKVPASISFAEAASIPVNYTTAAVALKEMCRIRKDDWVLVHGGAGGVGRMALQIAKATGAGTIATVGYDEKKKTAEEAGADHVINYRKESFVEQVNMITGNRGVDCILDPVGGKNLKKDSACLAPTGTIILFGLAAIFKNGRPSRFRLLRAFFRSLTHSPMLLMDKNQGIFGVNMLKFFGSSAEDIIQSHFKTGIESAAKKKIKPLIHKTYPLEEAPLALDELKGGKTVGKIILKIG